MTGSGSSFSVATTVFVSLAICAVISYGVFYYFKQRLAVIEHSQMEQARILQAIISRGLAQHAQVQPGQPGHPGQPGQPGQPGHPGHPGQPVQSAKEITITQNGLIEVSSDDESVSSSDSETETETESSSETEEDKWSIGDEIHQPESYHREFEESFRKNILLDAICIDSSYVIDSISIQREHEQADEDASTKKKIISLNKSALGNDDTQDADTNDEDEDEDEDDSSSTDEDQAQGQGLNQSHGQGQNQEQSQCQDPEFELKIGYTPKKEPLQLNYTNMAVSALRQLAKERGLGGDDADLQKLKKKDLVQLLQ